MSSSRKKKDAEAKEDLQPSILSKLVEEQTQQDVVESGDVFVLFSGMKKSGKTSLVDRFINPTKDEKDQPKPTVALDYKFARYSSDSSTTKVIAHIYDLGGDEAFDNLAAIPSSAATVQNLVVVITVDLSEPHHVVPALDKWLRLLRTHVEQGLQAFAAESSAAQAKVEAMRKEQQDQYQESQDKVTPFPVPLVVFGTKCDALLTDVDPEKRKGLCRALRFFSHTNGGHLLFTSVKDKGAMNNMRNLLRQLLFGVKASGKTALNEQLDPSKPLCVLAGKDTLQNIGSPQSSKGAGTGAAGWIEFMASLFPPPQAEKGLKKEGERVAEELGKYTETSVDGMVEQRTEELHQYRKQVERNQRLAGEGLDAGKIGGLLAS